jgi:predicted acylesterase/phospholipase RssA
MYGCHSKQGLIRIRLIKHQFSCAGCHICLHEKTLNKHTGEGMFWFSFNKPENPPVTGLVLPGGGAGNAYQLGVLKAIADLLPDRNDKPFPVITGTSSGALNAVLVATATGQLRQGLQRLTGVWENFHIARFLVLTCGRR